MKEIFKFEEILTFREIFGQKDQFRDSDILPRLRDLRENFNLVSLIDQSKWRCKFDKLILTKIKISRDSESDEDKTEKRKAGSPVLDPTQQKRQKIEVNKNIFKIEN